MTDRRLRIASYVIALVGVCAAGYLVYTKYAHGGVCGVSGGCTVVQQSEWSELFGIPVSVLGVVGYGLIFAALTLRGEMARLLLVLFSGGGFLFSMYLMYRAYITLDAFCPFCTTSAVCMTLLFVISATRFVRGPDLVAAATDLDADAEDDEVDEHGGVDGELAGA